jgi:hypothetical protein
MPFVGIGREKKAPKSARHQSSEANVKGGDSGTVEQRIGTDSRECQRTP